MSTASSPDSHSECGWCKSMWATAPKCWCWDCHDHWMLNLPDPSEGGPMIIGRAHMYLCPDCGNKRCPRATDHRRHCTRSNDPGQPGSAY